MDAVTRTAERRITSMTDKEIINCASRMTNRTLDLCKICPDKSKCVGIAMKKLLIKLQENNHV